MKVQVTKVATKPSCWINRYDARIAAYHKS
jgi:hypothetical protein